MAPALRRASGPAAGLLADDLTGALDAGLEAWRRSLGVRVLIPRAPEGRYAGLEAARDVVVLDTESRALDAASCRARLEAALGALGRGGVPLAYKKVDSTLRGNLGTEIELVLRAGAAEAVLLAPSLPRAGRTVRGGLLFVGGEALHRTEMARDPLWPMGRSEVAAIVAASSALPSAAVPLDAVRGPAPALAACMERSIRKGARLLVADAETEEDLRSIAAACAAVGSRLLPCGSAGLFAHVALPAARGPGPVGAGLPRRPSWHRDGPVLVLSGSTSEVAKEQLERAASEAGASTIRPARERLFGGAGEAREEAERLASAVEVAAARDRVVIVDGAVMSRAEIERACGGSAGEKARRGRLMLETLAGAFLRVRERVAGLVLVGGDTAVAVCRAARADGIEIDGEVEPLVPLGSLVGGPLEGLRLATKAGGLGSPQALAEAVRMLAGGAPG